MRSFSIRCVAGVLAMLLPAGVAFLARHLDRSKLRNAAIYKAMIPVMVCGSLLLAVVIPAVLVMSARMPLIYRVVITLRFGFCWQWSCTGCSLWLWSVADKPRTWKRGMRCQNVAD